MQVERIDMAYNFNTALPPMEQMGPYMTCIQATQTQINCWTRSLQLSYHSATSRDELCPQSSAIMQIWMSRFDFLKVTSSSQHHSREVGPTWLSLASEIVMV